MDLKCKKMNCRHNDGCACMCKEIKVNKKCECDTFESHKTNDPKQHQDISRNMFEVAPELHPFRHNKKINIECDADCLFNEGGTCHANGISVSNQHTAVCITNIPK